jgi:hypothetical protein
VHSEYRIDDRGGIEILTQICAASDRVEALAAQINEDGETIRTRTDVANGHVRITPESGRVRRKPSCLLWGGNPLSRSLLGVKQTSLIALHMSAYDPKRTTALRPGSVSSGQLATI